MVCQNLVFKLPNSSYLRFKDKSPFHSIEFFEFQAPSGYMSYGCTFSSLNESPVGVLHSPFTVISTLELACLATYQLVLQSYCMPLTPFIIFHRSLFLWTVQNDGKLPDRNLTRLTFSHHSHHFLGRALNQRPQLVLWCAMPSPRFSTRPQPWLWRSDTLPLRLTSTLWRSLFHPLVPTDAHNIRCGALCNTKHVLMETTKVTLNYGPTETSKMTLNCSPTEASAMILNYYYFRGYVQNDCKLLLLWNVCDNIKLH